jgi:hypothetical protein
MKLRLILNHHNDKKLFKNNGMMHAEILTSEPVQGSSILKKVLIVILCITFQSCVMDNVDLEVKLVNLSKDKVHVGELYECDSCGIMEYVKLYCSHGNDTTFFPRMLNGRDSTIMRTKLKNIEKVDIINADSLELYGHQGYTHNIADKKWVKVLTEKLDLEKKTCRIVIR